MTVMADYATYQRPHRRPVGGPALAPAVKPQQQYVQQPQQPPLPPLPQQGQPSPTHYHSRTASSQIFSPAAPHPASHAGHPAMPGTMGSNSQQYRPQQAAPQPSYQQIQQQQQQPQQPYPGQAYGGAPTRRMTNSTVSSGDSGHKGYPQQAHLATGGQTLPYRNASTNSSNTNLRRSTSSRSQASSLGPSSYVALLRKQKATVWCERTQHNDPRVVAQAKANKQRAAREIQSQGRNSIAISGTTAVASTGGVLGVRKKHGGKAVASNQMGAGINLAANTVVPVRLSVNEFDEEEGDDDDSVVQGGSGGVHRRTNSGKSSITGNNNPQTRLGAPRTNTRLSYGSAGRPGSLTGQTPSPGEQQPPPPPSKRASTGSVDSEERREMEMGGLSDMKGPSAAETQEAQRQNNSDLARRGSVDERSATMRGAAGAMRLFVANPDSDSD